MAAVKTLDVSREGEDLKILKQAGDMTVARLSQEFQASTTHLKLNQSEFCQGERKLLALQEFLF